MCIHAKCEIIASFNIIGKKRPLYCAKHKLDGMINVIIKPCKETNCKTQPVYNMIGEKQGIYCSNHKLDGMVNVKHKSCKEENCNKQPMYNIIGEQTLYCAKHKLDGMVDVKHKRCKEENCKLQPAFNIIGKTPLYCAKHKLDGMDDVINKPCKADKCKTKAAFNIIGKTKGIYCGNHKLDGMINVLSKTCKNEWCYTYVHKKYDGYCLFCYINMFPDKPVARNYKTKEYAVVEYVKTTFPELTIVADKIIAHGCSKRRPDILLDLGYQIIIVEIDENQHIDYDCSCENKRTMELSQDVGHRPIVFIRFNPDEYTNQDVAITSCWGNDKRGICSVKKSKQKEWKERLQTLASQITYWINPDNSTNKTIEIIQLFYDI
jgi:hypothetical protein